MNDKHEAVRLIDEFCSRGPSDSAAPSECRLRETNALKVVRRLKSMGVRIVPQLLEVVYRSIAADFDLEQAPCAYSAASLEDRRIALKSLVLLQPKVTRHLTNAFDHPLPTIRAHAARLIRKSKPPAVEPVLRKLSRLFEDCSAWVVWEAVSVASELQPGLKVPYEIMIHGLREGEVSSRSYFAAYFLRAGKHVEECSQRLLMIAAQDHLRVQGCFKRFRAWNGRIHAVCALGDIHPLPQRGKDLLELLLRDPNADYFLKLAMFTALVNMGEEALPLLRLGLNHPDVNVRKETLWVIRKLGNCAAPLLPELRQALAKGLLSAQDLTRTINEVARWRKGGNN